MSDQNAPHDQTIDTLKDAVLAQMQPAETLAGGKVGAAFDFEKFKGVLARLDHAVAPLAPIVATMTPPVFSAVVTALAAALHAADDAFNPPASANAPAGTTVI